MTGTAPTARPGAAAWLDPQQRVDPATMRRCLVALFLLSLAGRLVLLAWSGPIARGDTDNYLSVARNLVTHGALLERDALTGELGPYTLRTPGYPLLAAPFFALFESEASARMALAILQVVLVSTIPLMAVRLGALAFSPVVGLWAGLATALDPWLSYAALTLLGDAAFSVVYLPGFLVAQRAIERRDWTSALGWGLALAVATYFRPVAHHHVAAVVLVYLIAERRRLGRGLRLAAIAGGSALLLVALWQARNARVAGTWTLVTHQGRSLLWDTAHLTRPSTAADYEADARLARAREIVRAAPSDLPARRRRSGEPEHEGEAAYERLRIELGLSQAEADRLMARIALENVLANPHRYALRAVVNVPLFLTAVSMPVGMLWDLGLVDAGVRESLAAGRPLYPATNLALRALAAVAFGPFLLLGLREGWRGGGATRWLTLYVALVLLDYFLVVTLVTPDDRYRVPLHGPLSPFVAAGFLVAVQRWRHRLGS